MKWFLISFKRALDFKGRSRRKEFGYYILYNILIFFFVVFLVVLFRSSFLIKTIISTIWFIYFLISIIISIPLYIRRLHDIGKPGYYLFINLLPFLGNFAFFMMMITEGEVIDNKYGPNPKITYSEIDDIGQQENV